MSTPYDDTFTGSDGDGINSSIWTISGSPDIQNNMAELSNAGSFEGLSNKYTFSGNFQVDVDFAIQTETATLSWNARLTAYVDSTHQIYLGAGYTSSAKSFQRGYVNGGSWTYSQVSRTNSTGGMRIARSGNTFTVSYKDGGGSWTAMSGVTVTGSPVTIWLTIPRWDFNPNVTVRYDNYLIVSGYVAIQTETMSGGAVAGGSATVEWSPATQTEEVTMSGGAVAGGSATVEWSPVSQLLEVDMSGGAVCGGEAALVAVRSEITQGGAVAGGESVIVQILLQVVSKTSSGGAVAGGTALRECITSRTATGGAIVGGEIEPLWSDALPDDEELERDNIRQIVTARANGTSLRLRLAGSSVAAVTLTGASFGLRSGSTGNYAVTPTRLTFNGGANLVTIPAGGTVYTDWASITITKNQAYLFHMALEDATNWLKVKNSGGVKEYYKLAGVDDTMTESITGYSTSGRVTAIISVEVASLQLRNVTSIGGAVAGGTATKGVTRVPTVIGGVVLGGTAPYSTVLAAGTQEMIVIGVGGAVAGGVSDTNAINLIDASGGAVLGGTSVYRDIPIIDSVGGIVVGGTSAAIDIALIESVGGVVVGGASDSEAIVVMAGGVVLGGSAAIQTLVDVIGAGGAVVGNVPAYLFDFTMSMTGGIVAGGSAHSAKLPQTVVDAMFPHIPCGHWHVNVSDVPVWAFTEQWDKPHYNEATSISSRVNPVWVFTKDVDWTRGTVAVWPFTKTPNKL